MTDILERMRAADPAAHLTDRDVHPADASARAKVRALLARAELDSTSADASARSGIDEPTRPVLAPLRRRRRRPLAVAAAAAALAAGLVAFPIVRHATTDGPTATFGAPAAQAAELLEKAAEITPKDPPVAPGQYWEVTTVARDAANLSADGTFRMVKERRVDYFSVDASRPTITASVTLEKDAGVPATSAHDRDVRAWRFDLPPSQIPGTWSEPNMAFLRGLPRDPVALRTRLYADSAPLGLTPDGNAMQFATELLRSGIVPADLRASLFRVIKTIPGVEVRAHQATVDGRTGVAIGRVEPRNGVSTEIVVDPTGGTVIGERSVVDTRMEGWPAAGTVVWDAGVTRRVVDEVPADVRARAVCEVDRFPGRTQPSRC